MRGLEQSLDTSHCPSPAERGYLYTEGICTRQGETRLGLGIRGCYPAGTQIHSPGREGRTVLLCLLARVFHACAWICEGLGSCESKAKGCDRSPHPTDREVLFERPSWLSREVALPLSWRAVVDTASSNTTQWGQKARGGSCSDGPRSRS